MRRKSPGEIVGWVLLGIIAITGFALLFGFVLMWLWNWLMPSIFGLTTINYWQAVGIFILFKIVFGGWGGGHRGRSRRSRRHCRKEGDRDFSKWRHYDKFWREEGDAAYQDYITRQKAQPEGDDLEH